MFSEYNSSSYFVDLIALCFLLLPAYMVIPSALVRRILFILAGMFLIYFIAPRLVLFYVIFWLFVFLLQRAVAFSAERKGGTSIFWICLAMTLAPMVVWKLWYQKFNIFFNLLGNELVNMLSLRLWETDLAREIIIPIGMSFATFRAIDLLIKSYVGRFKGLSPDRVLFYGFFPPVQIVGPIIEYDEIQKHGDSVHVPKPDDFYQGFLLIVSGLFKVLVISGALRSSAEIFQTYEANSFYMVWGNLFLYTWFFYLNFSGYSDLAIGVSRLFGFRLKDNFNFPFFSRNISQFWNCWHISLSRFAQRNVYVPLGGYRKQTQYIAISATMMVIALWHDLTLGMVLFGLYHGAGLIVNRYVTERTGKKDMPNRPLGTLAGVFATYIFVTLSFPLLAMSLDRAVPFYRALFGG